MGRYTSSDVVPFVVHNVLHGGGHAPTSPLIYKLTGRALEDYEDEDDTGLIPEIKINDWELADDSVEIGKRKRIYASVWTKGAHKVYVVNESEYECVGVYDIALVADAREDLVAFISDVLEPNGVTVSQASIEDNDTVQQTI